MRGEPGAPSPAVRERLLCSLPHCVSVGTLWTALILAIGTSLQQDLVRGGGGMLADSPRGALQWPSPRGRLGQLQTGAHFSGGQEGWLLLSGVSEEEKKQGWA